MKKLPTQIQKKIPPTPQAINDLHPSWQAKKQLKQSITKFEGTKVTFD